MSPRSIRRAAERRALKEARKATPTQAAVPARTDRIPQLSEARLAANRANAQLSTGPTSEAGKRTSSLNAVKTALTGQTVLLPSDDVALYQALIHSLVERHKPVNDSERSLVQSLADTQWRLGRIPALEAALFARGRVEFAERFASDEPELAAALIDSETLVVYAKQLRNLHTQEGRLRRQYAQDLAALKALQEERSATEETAAAPSETKIEANLGFELTTARAIVCEQPPLATLNHHPEWSKAA